MKQLRFVLGAALVTLLPAATRVPACDLCSVYAATEAQGGTGKGWFGGVAEQFTRFSSLQSDGHTIANDGEYVNSLHSQLFAGYNFNRRFGMQLNVPVICREYHRDYTPLDDGHDFSPATRRKLGLGDIVLIGNFRAYQRLAESFTINWTLLGGLKLPTGDSAHLDPTEEEFATGIGGHDLTFGSGSVDGVIGTSVFARWKKVFLNAGVQYAIRSEGDFGYQYANDLTWSGGPGAYLVLEDRYTLALQAVVSGEYKGHDTLKGARVDDSAATMVYLGPQIQFTLGGELSAQLGADLPVYQCTTAYQLVPDCRVRAAVTARF
jgi:hypothetical protein